MDYSCRDIPMRLDIRYQPLNFDIYLSQVIDVPKTSVDERPYDFQLEVDALKHVDKLIEKTQLEREQTDRLQEPPNPIPSTSTSDLSSQAEPVKKVSNNTVASPSCPTETPLTPIKTTLNPTIPSNTDEQVLKESPAANQINLMDFEDIHYNPFDHLELQTIDELRELDLVFQASYANQTTGTQLQTTINDNSTAQNPPSTQVSRNTE